MIQTFDVLKAQEAFAKAVVISVALGYNAPQTILYIAIFWSICLSPLLYVLYKKYFSKKQEQA